jgi:hypothetical protein
MTNRQNAMRWVVRLGALSVLAACGGDDAKPATDASVKHDAGARMDGEDAGMELDAGPPPPMAATRVCSSDGFCWEAPLPQGETLHAAWSAAADDVWMVGEHGVLLHYDGASFRNVGAGTQEPLLAVHGSAADDVWAVGGGGVVLHYDGDSWTSTDVSNLIDASAGAMTGALYGVFAAAPDSVWAVGFSGVQSVILHFDGHAWTNQASSLMSDQTLRAVYGLSGQRVWAVGDKGTILSFDGAQWTLDKSSTQAALYAVHALVDHDVWAVGANVALRWNGMAWSNVSTGLSGTLQGVRVDIAAPPPSDAGMTTMPMMPADAGAPQPPKGPWSVWAFSASGQVFRYNGTLWAELPSGTMRAHAGAARLAPGVMLAVGEAGQIIRFDGDSRQNLSQGARGNHLSVWNDGRSVWAVGDDIERRDDRGWQVMQRPSERSLYGVWGDEHGLWAVGTAGSVARSENGGWKDVNVSAAGEAFLHAVTGAGSSVWIVGEGGLTLVSAAGSFIKVTAPVKSNLLDVWGADESNVWAVGEGGSVLRWDGMSWLKVPTGAMGGVVQNLRAVWGTGKDDLWVVGAESTILHWNGQRFESQSPGAKYTLNDVWGRAHDDVYAVGSGGVALHYDGQAWKTLETGTTSSLQSIIGDANGHVIAAGLEGTILVR